MKKYNKSSASPKHRGRPEEPLNVEIQFIDDGRASDMGQDF
jgi:hypothetical protein